MTWVDSERKALVDTFRAAGPAADTLCTGWTTRHLLAHLVQRENHPFANVADQVSRRAPGQEKHLGKLASTAATAGGYEALIARFAAGPHRWSPMSWAGEQLNLLEFVIHHEDVRRGGTSTPPARRMPIQENRVIFQRLVTLARFTYRGAPVEVTLATPEGNRHVVKKGSGQVELRGAPIELCLYLSGRQRAADVELNGPSAAIDTFLSWLDRA